MPEGNEQRGGARPGAGRPPKLKNQIARAEKLAKQLSVATKSELGKVAERMGDLVDTSLAMALGEHESQGGKPDREMLKMMLELGIRSIDPDELNERDAASTILRDALEYRTVEVKQENHYYNGERVIDIPSSPSRDDGEAGRSTE